MSYKILFLKKTFDTGKLYCIMRKNIIEMLVITIVTNIVLFSISKFTFIIPRIFLKNQYKFIQTFYKKDLIFTCAHIQSNFHSHAPDQCFCFSCDKKHPFIFQVFSIIGGIFSKEVWCKVAVVTVVVN